MQDIAHRIANKVAAGRVLLPIEARATWNGQHPEVHEVFVRDLDSKPVVTVAGTGGSWYAEDFLRGSGRLWIDMGEGYRLDNADEIRAAVRKLLSTSKTEEVVDATEFMGLARDFGNSANHGLPVALQRRKLRDMLTAATSFVRALFGERDAEAFSLFLTKLRSAETSRMARTAGEQAFPLTERAMQEAAGNTLYRLEDALVAQGFKPLEMYITQRGDKLILGADIRDPKARDEAVVKRLVEHIIGHRPIELERKTAKVGKDDTVWWFRAESAFSIGMITLDTTSTAYRIT